MNTNRNQFFLRFSPGNSWISILVGIVFFIALFYIANGIFRLLTWLAPFLFIVTLIINYRVVLTYGRWLLDALRRNPLFGLISILLTIIGFPVVAAALFVQALLIRRVNTTRQTPDHPQYRQQESEYVDFEEINEHPRGEEELPPLRSKEEKLRKNDNDPYFQ